uniref:Uncharacterized protein n=1 Tax=Romanomermis culicivorax TaxID=13658 RepID=A0A915K2U3_ROMCU
MKTAVAARRNINWPLVRIFLKKSGQKLEHQGIRIEFIGQIEVYYDRGNHTEFCSLTKHLAQPGDLMHNTDFRFEFTQVEKPFESYTGANVKLRYFLRVIIARRLSDIVREFDILVHTLSTYPDGGSNIRMEVGIEDCLHIEFEYDKSRYHLKDVIVGKIYFLLVRIKIKHMEITIIKRESVGPGPNMYNDSDTIAKYEIMDGAPVKSESIPIRLFLAGYDLTPTMKEVNKKFSVRYYLNLVLIDEEDRRYFKQQKLEKVNRLKIDRVTSRMMTLIFIVYKCETFEKFQGLREKIKRIDKKSQFSFGREGHPLCLPLGTIIYNQCRDDADISNVNISNAQNDCLI